MNNFDSTNKPFQQAVSFINQTGKHLFLTGNAGTGKTTFLRYIKNNCFKKLAIVAPTGVAAINAGGVTIHSFFQIPPGVFLPTLHYNWEPSNHYINNPASLLRNLRMNAAKKEMLQELELLIIDEVSMLRADMLDAIDTVLRHVRRKNALPFGGVQVLYIGDLYQLPPVTKTDEWNLMQEFYNSPFFFDALALKQSSPLFIELKKIYRQTDENFIGLLNKVRNNCCREEDLHFLNSFCNPSFNPAEEENYVTLTSHNNKADAINQRKLDQLPTKKFTYEAQVEGDFNERAFPADPVLHLKEGAQVMFIKNDKGESRRFFNGKIAVIKSINDENITVSFPGEENELDLEKETWRNIRYHFNKEKDSLEEEEIGHFTQYPIRLAWAITIHKSQGLTFQKAIIDAGASFAPGQVYVALSRLTSLDGLVLLSKIHSHNIGTDERVRQFAGNELDEEEMNEILQAELHLFLRSSVKKPFEWDTLLRAVEQLAESFEERLLPEKQTAQLWCGVLLHQLQTQDETARKFTRQLTAILEQNDTGSFDALHERTKAATEYFIKVFTTHLLPGLNEQLAVYAKLKRTKSYLKDLQDIKLLIERQVKQLENVVEVTKAMKQKNNLSQLLQLAGEMNKPVPVKSENIVVPKQKREKGTTQKLSLEMYLKGQKVSEIAKERNLANGTIETHLFSFIATGEVNVYDFITEDKLKLIVSLLKKDSTHSLSSARQVLGDDFSYTEINAGFKYFKKENQAATVH